MEGSRLRVASCLLLPGIQLVVGISNPSWLSLPFFVCSCVGLVDWSLTSNFLGLFRYIFIAVLLPFCFLQYASSYFAKIYGNTFLMPKTFSFSFLILLVDYLIFKVVEASLALCWLQHLLVVCVSASSWLPRDFQHDNQFRWSVQTFSKI